MYLSACVRYVLVDIAMSLKEWRERVGLTKGISSAGEVKKWPGVA